jgi:FixJ family two-component response regulator
VKPGGIISRKPRASDAGKVVIIVVRNSRVVAVVEDDPNMLKGVERLLQAHGFMTEVYTSAEAYLEGADASEADCLILDIKLGGISGIELQHRLTAAGSKLPVIFMTAVDSEVVRREVTRAGGVAYLRKPFLARQLIDAIGKTARS